ncbi:MAG: (d)CMP kinase [Candidatus Altiarchaeota archaeon]
MIVTIGGQVASGKSTLARELARRLGYKHISAGSVMRQMAAEKNTSLLEFSEYAETHPEVDKLIDERQKELASQGDCVVEGRISAYFIPADYKVWLTCGLSERVRRARGRGDSDADIKKAILAREKSEQKRYKKFYDIDLSDTSIYDLVLDTTKIGIKEMVQKVEEKIRETKTKTS